jgi:hypothetical protein
MEAIGRSVLVICFLYRGPKEKNLAKSEREGTVIRYLIANGSGK